MASEYSEYFSMLDALAHQLEELERGLLMSELSDIIKASYQ